MPSLPAVQLVEAQTGKPVLTAAFARTSERLRALDLPTRLPGSGALLSGPIEMGCKLRAKGIRQHLIRHPGPGPQMLLIPGITSPAIAWGFMAERLAERFDVHVLDVRGRGLSETGDLDDTLDAMVPMPWQWRRRWTSPSSLVIRWARASPSGRRRKTPRPLPG